MSNYWVFNNWPARDANDHPYPIFTFREWTEEEFFYDPLTQAVPGRLMLISARLPLWYGTLGLAGRRDAQRIVEQQGNHSINAVSHGQIRSAIAIEVRHRGGVRVTADAEGYWLLKLPVTVAEQDGDVKA